MNLIVETIAGDGGSTDGTEELVGQFAKARRIYLKDNPDQNGALYATTTIYCNANSRGFDFWCLHGRFFAAHAVSALQVMEGA